MKRSSHELTGAPTPEQAFVAESALTESLGKLYEPTSSKINGGHTTLYNRTPRKDVIGLKVTGSQDVPTVAIHRASKGMLLIDDQRDHFAVTRLNSQRYRVIYAFSLLDNDLYSDGYELASYEMETTDNMSVFDVARLSEVINSHEPLSEGRVSFGTLDLDGVELANEMSGIVNEMARPNVFKAVIAKLIP